MNIRDMLDLLFPISGNRQLTPAQEAIVNHPNGPAWLLAGPGSGKTEVLSLLVLRLLYVSNDPVQAERVPPDSIIVTTFTEKAARNLEDRISQYRSIILSSHPQLSEIDISKLRIGTLHGLCNDILQEIRSPNYQNVRLMDDFEQSLFVREHLSLIKQSNPTKELAFWSQFPWMFLPYQWQSHYSYPPNKWNSTHAIVSILNRLVEDRVSISGLRAAGGQLTELANLFDEYSELLNINYRCDFSQLQLRFLQFLQSNLGQAFVNGADNFPGIKWVLVDEYQDTNPIQEEIYFELSKVAPHNLVVVGDDDQAMYRFRGGSVECMVSFNDACNAFLGLSSNSIKKYPLIDNFRSHSGIVSFFNEYISSFPVMNKPGARVKKPPINPMKTITQTYPAVSRISHSSLQNVAALFAETVRGLVDNGIVNDPSECCLLLKSTKETPNNAKKYVDALHAEGFDVYNPRNKSFSEQEEVQAFLGTLLAIFDPNRRVATDPSDKSIPTGESIIRATYDRLASTHSDLLSYVNNATKSITSKAGNRIETTLQEIAYFILSLEPFNSWQYNPTRRIRLGKITQLLEAYSSMPVLDPTTGLPRENVRRGSLKASSSFPGEVDEFWLKSFYRLFIGYVLEAGFDDEEDEEVIVPTGMIPVMTMHQSKGLEFPFVFVGHLGENPKISSTHELETIFSVYPSNPKRSFARAPANERAAMDMIRQYYVAYSRAEYALILLGSTSHFAKEAIPLGPTKYWVRHRTNQL